MRSLWNGVALALLACPPLLAAPPTAGSCAGMLGVWEYKEPTQGRAIITKLGDKYTIVFFQLNGRQMGPVTGASTEAQKAAALDALSAGASEYTCEGSGGKLRLKGRTIYSAKPDPAGPAWTLDMELTGDDARWWFLGSDGARAPMAEARRVK